MAFNFCWSTEKLWSISDNHVCVAALYERMRADQRKFGKSAWAAAVERMERLQYAVSKETLQLMRAKEICLEQKKHGLKEEVQYTVMHTDASQETITDVV